MCTMWWIAFIPCKRRSKLVDRALEHTNDDPNKYMQVWNSESLIQSRAGLGITWTPRRLGQSSFNPE